MLTASDLDAITERVRVASPELLADVARLATELRVTAERLAEALAFVEGCVRSARPLCGGISTKARVLLERIDGAHAAVDPAELVVIDAQADDASHP